VVEENRSALNGLTTHVASITEKLDRGAGTLGRLVNDPKLYERVTDTVADVQQSVREIGAVARNLNEGQGTLGKLLARDDTLYRQAEETIDNLSVAARNAEEITDGLRAGEGTLGKALVDSKLYDQSLDTLRTRIAPRSRWRTRHRSRSWARSSRACSSRACSPVHGEAARHAQHLPRRRRPGRTAGRPPQAPRPSGRPRRPSGIVRRIPLPAPLALLARHHGGRSAVLGGPRTDAVHGDARSAPPARSAFENPMTPALHAE
jgi:hypothetical protein